MNEDNSKEKSYLAAKERVFNRADQISQTRQFLIGKLPDPTSEDYKFGSLFNAMSEHFAPAVGLNRRLDTRERLIGSNDIVSIEFLEAGIYAARPVGRISFSANTHDGVGTGFLVAPGLMMTNNHVIPDPTMAMEMIFRLNYEENQIGNAGKYFDYTLDPESFYFTDPVLDFTIVALEENSGSLPVSSSFGWHVLSPEPLKAPVGAPISIIQHPLGRPKSIVVHNSNLLVTEDENEKNVFCWYSGDTRKGSSGSPVFDRNWNLIALHHQAVEKRDKNGNILGKDGGSMSEQEAIANENRILWLANEGIRTQPIFHSVDNWQPQEMAEKEVKKKLMSVWSNPKAAADARISKALI